MQYSRHSFRIYWMYGKIFLVSLCRAKRYEWFPGEKNFCSKKITARLSRLNQQFLSLGSVNFLGIRKSDIKGSLDCLQPHSYTNSYILIKKQQYNIRLLMNNFFATKDVKRNVGSFSTMRLQCLKKLRICIFNFKYII